MSRKPMNNIVHCADGFSMSVQASGRHYCDPKSDTGPYTHVEVGMVKAWDYYLQPFADDRLRPTDTVYGYVPSDTVIMCIDAHGGMVAGELPPLVKTEIEAG